MTKPLKVLQFICSTGFYGAERWILALANNSDKQRVEHQLATTLEADNQQLELSQQFAHIGQTYRLAMSHRFDLSVVSQLVTLIQRERIDLIHTHGYKSDILGIWAAKKAGIPVVVTPHGFENTRDLKLRTFIWLGNQAMRFADMVVPLSTELLHRVRHFGIAKNRLQYIQNGVDLREIELSRETPCTLNTTKTRIGFIGQMISRKNIDDLLDTFDRLWRSRENVELVLLGDGDARPGLEQKAKALAAAQDIHFLGYRDDRLEYLKSFDLFAMTSTLEGIPRCLMEAMAMGVVSVAYDIAGIDQLIEHEKTGLLAPLHDKDSLLTCWQRVLDNPAYRAELVDNAQQFVNNNYSARRMAQQYTELFERLVHTS